MPPAPSAPAATLKLSANQRQRVRLAKARREREERRRRDREAGRAEREYKLRQTRQSNEGRVERERLSHDRPAPPKPQPSATVEAIRRQEARAKPRAERDPTGLNRIQQPGSPEYERATRHRIDVAAPARYVAEVGEALVRGAAWSFTHPAERLTGDIPEEFMPRDPETGLQLSSGEFPWGPVGKFFRPRRGAPVKPGQPAPHSEVRVPLTEERRAQLKEIVARDTEDYNALFVKDSAEKALARGYEYVRVRGTAPPMPRSSRPADVAPKPSVPGAEKIVASLGAAKRLRLQQEKLYREERGRRGGRSEAAAEEVGGQEGYRAALSELKGELPKLRFGALEGQMDQPMVDKLFTHVQRREDLRPYEKLNAQRALSNALEGRVPTRGDIRMLGRVFGPDTAAQIQGSVPFWAKAKNVGLNVINVPRSLKASFDLSAPFRQGLVLGARHPRMFATEFRPMVKAFRSEGAYRDVMDDIASRPTFPAMQKARVALTDLEGLAMREEQFMSNYAEHIPVVGRGVRASGRAYVAFLNKFRADAFDHYLQVAESQGHDITDPALLKSIGQWVNHATGRGSVKSLEGAMVPLNALLFSPRLIASRLNLLNPAFYLKLDPFARKQALRGMTQLASALSLTLWMAKMAGADVGLDPRSSDFGKIKIGDTRVDVAGGFQQYLVVASRLAKGEMVSSTSGKLTALEGGFAKPSRADILQRFGEQKLAPVPAFANAWAKNETFTGDEFSPAKEAGKLVVPLGWEATYGTAREAGAPAAAATAVLGGIGFGVQTYESKTAKNVWRRISDEREEVFAAAKQKAPDELVDGKLPVELRQSFNRKAERFATYAALEAKKGDKLTERDRYIADVRMFQRWGLATQEEVLEGVRWAQDAPEAEIARMRRGFSRDQGPWGEAYLVGIRYAKKSLGVE